MVSCSTLESSSQSCRGPSRRKPSYHVPENAAFQSDRLSRAGQTQTRVQSDNGCFSARLPTWCLNDTCREILPHRLPQTVETSAVASP
jgi:hypothetical protein